MACHPAERDARAAAKTETAAGGAAGDLLRITVFSVDSQRYGLPVAVTQHVVPMVAVSPLPGAPDCVAGAINLRGDVVPVLDVRRRLGLALREHGPEARLLVARSRLGVVALAVDDVEGVTEVEATALRSPDAVVPGIDHVSALAAVPDGLILIHDLDAFFSIEEERQLAASLAEARP